MKYLFIVLFLLFFIDTSFAEENKICITDQEAVDLTVLLDASERDLELLDSCRKLVKDLYKEIDNRDLKIETLTTELISAKQESLSYATSSKRWRTVAFVTSATTITILLVQILPAL